MKKIALLFILILILITSLVKNSTKEIEDKTSIINENIRSLKAEFSDVMLEYNYLSSPEKLIKYQAQYFENNLIKIDVTKIKNIKINDSHFEVTNFIDKFESNE